MKRRLLNLLTALSLPLRVAVVARRAGYDAAPVSAAAICSALLPGEGTAVGTLLASFANAPGRDPSQNATP